MDVARMLTLEKSSSTTYRLLYETDLLLSPIMLVAVGNVAYLFRLAWIPGR